MRVPGLHWLLALVLAGCSGAWAAPPAGCPEAQPGVTSAEVLAGLGLDPDTSGLMLWRFSGERGEGYVFGTVHLGPPFISRAPAPALLAIRESAVFASEVLMDEAAQAEFMARASVAPDTVPVIDEASLGPELLARYVELAARRGIPAEVALRLEAWSAFLSIGRPALPPGATLDEQLQHTASRMGREVAGLQSLRSLVDTLESIPRADQIAILADTICQQESLRTFYRSLLEVYSTGVPEAVVAFNRAGRADDPIFERLETLMVRERNPLFVERILALLARGSVFVAIGVQHLPGPDGVLERLREAGFSVAKTY